MLILAIGPLLAIAIGWALCWVGTSRAPSDDPTAARLFIFLGAFLVILGVGFGIAINGHFISLILLFAMVAIILSSITRFYVAERHSLIWVLTVAAERGIPLESAARAFAEERNDLIGRRANLLADYLEAGVPLSLAITRSRCSVSPAVQLAADLGQQTGTLGVGLRQASSVQDAGEATLRSMIEKFFYLVVVFVMGLLVVSFLLLKIVPVIAKMFDDFGLELPELTRLLISFADLFVSSGLVVPIMLFMFAMIGLMAICYIGFSPRKLPLIGRLWWSADCALVMHWMAVAVRQKLPLGEMIRMLAVNFPQAKVRRRLERASARIDRGQNWCDSLRATGIFRRRENVLFKSAERAGNLAWALDEMAQSGIRRTSHRMRVWSNILFPLVVIGFGGIVLFICLGSFLPLVSLISGLS